MFLYFIQKDEAFANQNQGSKEKRPFLRKRQGLAHYQAPPKRRQSCPKTNDNHNNNTKNEVKGYLEHLMRFFIYDLINPLTNTSRCAMDCFDQHKR